MILSPTKFRAHLLHLRWVTGLLIALFVSVLGQAKAGIITAASPTLADVASAVAAASEGDVVIIPTGTASWTSTLTVTKGITLRGANVNTADDHTVIVDDVPIVDDKCILLDVQLTQNQVFRLTGITFRGGSRTLKPANAAAVKIGGTCPGSTGTGSVRIDRCHFDQLYQRGIYVEGWIYGVIDHNRWDQRANIGSLSAIVMNNGSTYGGGTNNFGDGSWAAPTNFGSVNFMFVEDNVFNNLGTAQTVGGIDCQNGGRYVQRYNQYLNSVMITGHGTESGGRIRGQRAIERYNNTWTGTLGQSAGLTRSGVVIYFNNAWIGPMNSQHIPLTVFRQDFPYKTYTGSGGNAPWDIDATESDGTHVDGHSPYLFASGVAGAGSTVATLVVTGAGWAIDRWVGFSVTNLDQVIPQTTGIPIISRIISNTSDTITFDSETPDPLPNHIPNATLGKSFSPGDHFEIRKVLISIDQPGRGKCDLLAGATPVNTLTGGANWPHQALEPAYGWNNKVNGNLIGFGSDYPTLQENRDYYSQTNSFNGTAGVGVGTLANRPATCTPGVAYWATDQGEWDSTHAGPDGQMYVCTAPNTWTLKYKPYVYPHPLVSGAPAPARPTNLRVIAGP